MKEGDVTLKKYFLRITWMIILCALLSLSNSYTLNYNTDIFPIAVTACEEKEQEIYGYMDLYGINTYVVDAHTATLWPQKNFTSATLDALYSRLEWARQNDKKVILALAVGWFPPDWWWEEHQNAYAVSSTEVVVSPGVSYSYPKRPSYGYDPFFDFIQEFLEEKINITKLALDYGDVIINWYVENEPHMNMPPGVYDVEEFGVMNYTNSVLNAMFREFLKSDAKYKNSIQSLNSAWTTSYSSFEEINGPYYPPDTNISATNNKTLLDWIEFRTQSGMIDWYDYNPNMTIKYREWLENKYTHVSNLNSNWTSNFANFLEIDSPRLHNFDLSDIANDIERCNILDWIAFRQEILADFQAKIRDLMQDLTDIPSGLKYIYSGVGWINAYTASDFELLVKATDLPQPDIYGDAALVAIMLDMIRSWSDDPIWIGELNDWAADASDLASISWSALGHGAKGITYYAWHPWAGEYHPELALTSTGLPNQKTDQVAYFSHHVHRVSPLILNSTVVESQIAIYWPQRSWQMMPEPNPYDIWKIHNYPERIYLKLKENGYNVDFVTDRQIKEGVLDNYKVLFLMYAQDLEVEVANKVQSFVSNGGLLFADYLAGYYDYYHRHNETAGYGNSLVNVLGVTSKAFDWEQEERVYFNANASMYDLTTSNWFVTWPTQTYTIVNTTSTKVLARVGADPIVVENSYGSGTAISIGTFINGKYHWNDDLWNDDYLNPYTTFLRKLILNVIKNHSVQKISEVTSTDAIQSNVLKSGNNSVIVLTNHLPNNRYENVELINYIENVGDIKKVLYAPHDSMNFTNITFTIDPVAGSINFTLPYVTYGGLVLLITDYRPIVAIDMPLHPPESESFNATVYVWNLQSTPINSGKIYITQPKGWHISESVSNFGLINAWGVYQKEFTITIPSTLSTRRHIITAIAEIENTMNTTPCTQFFLVKTPAKLAILKNFSSSYPAGRTIGIRFLLENVGGERADNVIIELLPHNGIEIIGQSRKSLGSIDENELKQTGWDFYATRSGVYKLIMTIEYTTMYGRVSENITFIILVVGDEVMIEESEDGLIEKVEELRMILLSSIASIIMIVSAFVWRRSI